MRKSLDDITDEDLAEIKNLAAVFYSPKEIAMIRDYDIALFVDECNAEGTKCYQAYYGGMLQSEYELRTSIVKLAKAGSSPAQTMSMDLLKQSKVKRQDK
jgi:hypothetical protein